MNTRSSPKGAAVAAESDPNLRSSPKGAAAADQSQATDPKLTEIFERLCVTFPHADIVEQLTNPEHATYAWYDESGELLAVAICD